MLFSEKENVFMCLDVTKLVLRKINSGVWFIQIFLQKMHQIRQKKPKPSKRKWINDEQRATSDAMSDEWRAVRSSIDERACRTRTVHRSRRSSINERCDHSDDRTTRSHRSRRSSVRCDRPTSGAIDDRCSPIWALSSLTFSLIWALSLSLSLSLSPEMNWSENEGEKSFPGQRWKFRSTGS